MSNNIQSAGGETNYEKMDIYYPEKKEETPINTKKEKKSLNIYIFIAISLVVIIGLIIFLIIFFVKKKDDKNKDDDDEKKEFTCDDGYYIPDGEEKIKDNCLKCSLDNCKICNGNNITDYCISCLSNYFPIYDNDNLTFCEPKCQT